MNYLRYTNICDLDIGVIRDILKFANAESVQTMRLTNTLFKSLIDSNKKCITIELAIKYKSLELFYIALHGVNNFKISDYIYSILSTGDIDFIDALLNKFKLRRKYLQSYNYLYNNCLPSHVTIYMIKRYEIFRKELLHEFRIKDKNNSYDSDEYINKANLYRCTNSIEVIKCLFEYGLHLDYRYLHSVIAFDNFDAFLWIINNMNDDEFRKGLATFGETDISPCDKDVVMWLYRNGHYSNNIYEFAYCNDLVEELQPKDNLRAVTPRTLIHDASKGVFNIKGYSDISDESCISYDVRQELVYYVNVNDNLCIPRIFFDFSSEEMSSFMFYAAQHGKIDIPIFRGIENEIPIIAKLGREECFHDYLMVRYYIDMDDERESEGVVGPFISNYVNEIGKQSNFEIIKLLIVTNYLSLSDVIIFHRLGYIEMFNYIIDFDEPSLIDGQLTNETSYLHYGLLNDDDIAYICKYGSDSLVKKMYKKYSLRVDDIIRFCSLEIIKDLCIEGTACNINVALRYRNLKIAKYLINKSDQPFDKFSLREAKANNKRAVAWLTNNDKYKKFLSENETLIQT